jgi:DNA-binding PadR family transcriptional regulator
MSVPNIEPQNLARSCNEALILSCLETGPMHGYQIALEIRERGRGFFHFNYGTLYPILHSMEKAGLVKGNWSPGISVRDRSGSEDARRKRKQYTLTAKGRKYAQQQRSSWRDFISNFLHVLEVVEA